MGSIQPNIPNTPNNVGDSWEPLVGQHVICRQGDNHVSLTEWSIANTDRPLVAGGSSIEVNGSIVSWPGDTAIVNDTGLASGTVYLLIDTSGAVNGIPTLVNDAPVWVASKNGFYRGANERYTGHFMEWDGATSYTAKVKFLDTEDGNIQLLDRLYDRFGKEIRAVRMESQHYNASISGLQDGRNFTKVFTFTDDVKALTFLANSYMSDDDDYVSVNGYVYALTISGHTVTVSVTIKSSEGSASIGGYWSCDIGVVLI